MKNKLSDLNNHLFAQLERLSDESMSKEEVQLEINRAQAISKISREVIDNASLVLKAQKLIMDGEVEQKPIEKVIGHGSS